MNASPLHGTTLLQFHCTITMTYYHHYVLLCCFSAVLLLCLKTHTCSVILFCITSYITPYYIYHIYHASHHTSFHVKSCHTMCSGLIGWLVIDLGMAAQQLQQDGSLSMSMILITLFQGFYVWDALHAEKSILSTMDITTDGFGFMLAFGDLAWVPFIYSLQARYLVDHDPHLSLPIIVAIVSLQCFGYYVFRAANSEKDTFRRNPSDPRVRHLTFLETKRGTRLITSGEYADQKHCICIDSKPVMLSSLLLPCCSLVAYYVPLTLSSVFVSVCLCLHLCLSLSVCPFCHFISLWHCLSIHPSLSLSLSIHLSISV